MSLSPILFARIWYKIVQTQINFHTLKNIFHNLWMKLKIPTSFFDISPCNLLLCVETAVSPRDWLSLPGPGQHRHPPLTLPLLPPCPGGEPGLQSQTEKLRAGLQVGYAFDDKLMSTPLFQTDFRFRIMYNQMSSFAQM